jgi:hypothetical protein
MLWSPNPSNSLAGIWEEQEMMQNKLLEYFITSSDTHTLTETRTWTHIIHVLLASTSKETKILARSASLYTQAKLQKGKRNKGAHGCLVFFVEIYKFDLHHEVWEIYWKAHPPLYLSLEKDRTEDTHIERVSGERKGRNDHKWSKERAGPPSSPTLTGKRKGQGRAGQGMYTYHTEQALC